jgi:crotonobetainyl-CoA:carnitine CoA-transferase CaiB-like acyl-CoA transferase
MTLVSMLGCAPRRSTASGTVVAKGTALTAHLLTGISVLDLGGDETAQTARMLADLGADVTVVATRAAAQRSAVWRIGTRSVEPGSPQLQDALSAADVVLDSVSATSAPRPGSAPHAAWVRVTPYGGQGPRSSWRGSDLTCLAASGNLYPTGQPDLPPVRCSQPSTMAHVGAEAAVAALTALASGRPQHVDVSIQATVMSANMTGPARFPETGDRGSRRGHLVGRTREVWPCQDGFVSFGLRGGAARTPGLQTLTRIIDEHGLATPALTDRDWAAYDHRRATDAELDAIAQPIGEFFARKSRAELYELAVDTGLMIAPINGPEEILANAQLAARELFSEVVEGAVVPGDFARIRVEERRSAPPAPRTPGSDGPDSSGPDSDGPGTFARTDRGAWAGLRLLELGSGAAGPLITRYFALHGATVVRVESTRRPDFLRYYAGTKPAPALEASPFFANLNAGKRSVTLNLSDPRGVEIARRLIGWADAVVENFAPGVMQRWGLDYDTLAPELPGLVMVSSCLLGQTGPHRHYPGFGGQGSALAGYTFLTGWPDREPVGPFGTITDSLGPRFSATALAAALLRRRRTGSGAHLDVSQVEAAIYTLSPWLEAHGRTGEVHGRVGNRDDSAVPHGVFPCAGADRWIALAVWDDDSWARLARLAGLGDDGLSTFAARVERVDEVEQLIAAWTSTQDAQVLATRLQTEGIDAYPVLDFGDLHDDPQLQAWRYFTPVEHPVLGEHLYDGCGFRLESLPAAVPGPGPTMGQHNDEILEILGLRAEERQELAEAGVLT